MTTVSSLNVGVPSTQTCQRYCKNSSLETSLHIGILRQYGSHERATALANLFCNLWGGSRLRKGLLRGAIRNLGLYSLVGPIEGTGFDGRCTGMIS